MKPEEKGRFLIPGKSLCLCMAAQQSCEKRKHTALVVVVVGVVICRLYKQPSRKRWICLWLLRGMKVVDAPFGAGKPRVTMGQRGFWGEAGGKEGG